jgi:hypothetical protein
MNDQTKPDPLKKEKTHRRASPGRISFLLRLWCEGDDGCTNLRASLETLETNKRIGFASLEQLFIYLIDLSESRADVQEKENKE